MLIELVHVKRKSNIYILLETKKDQEDQDNEVKTSMGKKDKKMKDMLCIVDTILETILSKLIEGCMQLEKSIH